MTGTKIKHATRLHVFNKKSGAKDTWMSTSKLKFCRNVIVSIATTDAGICLLAASSKQIKKKKSV